MCVCLLYSYFNGLMWCGTLIPYVSLKSVTQKLSISYSGYKCTSRDCNNTQEKCVFLSKDSKDGKTVTIMTNIRCKRNSFIYSSSFYWTRQIDLCAFCKLDGILGYVILYINMHKVL